MEGGLPFEMRQTRYNAETEAQCRKHEILRVVKLKLKDIVV